MYKKLPQKDFVGIEEDWLFQEIAKHISNQTEKEMPLTRTPGIQPLR